MLVRLLHVLTVVSVVVSLGSAEWTIERTTYWGAYSRSQKASCTARMEHPAKNTFYLRAKCYDSESRPDIEVVYLDISFASAKDWSRFMDEETLLSSSLFTPSRMELLSRLGYQMMVVRLFSGEVYDNYGGKIVYVPFSGVDKLNGPGPYAGEWNLRNWVPKEDFILLNGEEHDTAIRLIEASTTEFSWEVELLVEAYENYYHGLGFGTDGVLGFRCLRSGATNTAGLLFRLPFTQEFSDQEVPLFDHSVVAWLGIARKFGE